jgi:hypothetical protein
MYARELCTGWPREEEKEGFGARKEFRGTLNRGICPTCSTMEDWSTPRRHGIKTYRERFRTRGLTISVYKQVLGLYMLQE